MCILMVTLICSGISTVGPSGACAPIIFSGVAKPSQTLYCKRSIYSNRTVKHSIQAVSKANCAPLTLQI